MSKDQLNKTNDLLAKINRDDIYRQVNGYLLNNLNSLNNDEFTLIYKILGNIELMDQEVNGVKMGTSKMRRRLQEDFMKRVKEFDLNHLFDLGLGYSIGDDKQMLEQINKQFIANLNNDQLFRTDYKEYKLDPNGNIEDQLYEYDHEYLLYKTTLMLSYYRIDTEVKSKTFDRICFNLNEFNAKIPTFYSINCIASMAKLFSYNVIVSESKRGYYGSKLKDLIVKNKQEIVNNCNLLTRITDLTKIHSNVTQYDSRGDLREAKWLSQGLFSNLRESLINSNKFKMDDSQFFNYLGVFRNFINSQNILKIVKEAR